MWKLYDPFWRGVVGVKQKLGFFPIQILLWSSSSHWKDHLFPKYSPWQHYYKPGDSTCVHLFLNRRLFHSTSSCPIVSLHSLCIGSRATSAALLMVAVCIFSVTGRLLWVDFYDPYLSRKFELGDFICYPDLYCLSETFWSIWNVCGHHYLTGL